MPDITIGDFTESIEINVADGSFLALRDLRSLSTAASKVVAFFRTPVNESGFQSAKFSSTFGKSFVPIEGTSLGIKASVNSIVAVAREADSPLFGSDDFDTDVTVGKGECWISFELDTLLDAKVGVPLPQGFGVSFEASSAPTFTTFLLIPAADAATTTLTQAFEKALRSFRIPVSANDVLSLPEGVIQTNDVSGTAKFGGSWSLPLAVNQLSLADATLPFNADVALNPALTLAVKGSVALTSEFQVRFRRVSAGALHLGLFRKHGSTLKASFSAGAGLGANLADTDLISAFFTAVSPGIDKGDLPAGDFAKISQVLNDSIDRSLSVSLNAACSAADFDEAAVVFDIDVTAPDQATKDAVGKALLGDWTDLGRLKNARRLRDVVEQTVQTKASINVSVLGIYNSSSVASFLRRMKVITEPASGSVVITDTLNATRITTASTPLAADRDRLLRASWESFLATAVYKGLLTGIGVSPVFKSRQAYFDYHESMDYADALKELNGGQSLGVVPLSVKAGLPPVGGHVKHARLEGSCDYSNEDVLRFFFSDIATLKPRTAPDLKITGRNVLAALLNPQDSTDHKRIVALQSDEKWQEMDKNPAIIAPPFSSDWLLITEWAEALAQVGPVLAKTIAVGREVQGDPTANPAFMKQRNALALALDGATHKTRSVFEGAFPLCVMATLAGHTPGNPSPVFEATWNSRTIFSNHPPALLVASVAGD